MLGAIQKLRTTTTEQLGLLLLQARLRLPAMDNTKFHTNSSKPDVPIYLSQTG